MLNIAAGAPASTGYNLTRSLRFRASASANLTRTNNSSPTDFLKYSISFWAKLGSLGTVRRFFDSTTTSTGVIGLNASDQLVFSIITGGAATFYRTTSNLLRDPSAWYHIVFTCDTSISSGQFKFYINGVEATYSTSANLTAGFGTAINSASATSVIGRSPAFGNNFDGYLAEINFIDGQTLAPSSFGSTNALTGVWQPAAYVGTYGTNGFYLPFTDNSTAAALGTDFSGNSNTWTVNNISVTAGVTYDSMTDVPTLTSATAANYCVLNPLDSSSASNSFSGANLNVTLTSSASLRGSFYVSTGKWYYEVRVNTLQNLYLGLASNAGRPTSYTLTSAFGVNNAGDFYEENALQTEDSIALAAGSVYGIAFDASAKRFWISKDGQWYSCDRTPDITITVSDVEAGTFGYDFSTLTGNAFAPHFGNSVTAGAAVSANFGQRPFTYTPPTGFVALNTFNLPASTIVKGNTVMDAVIDTGANIRTTTEALFPSNYFEWIKDRANVNNYQMIDIVRGSTAVLQSNAVGAETTYTTPSGNSVGWAWKAGGAAVSNTDGSITSQVSANASAGFSIVSFNGTGANATVGHGLGVAPSMLIVKARTSSNAWRVGHNGLTSWANYLALDDDSVGQASSVTIFNSTAPTSSVFSVGTSATSNENTKAMIAYCFAPIQGYSAFGSYTGNGSGGDLAPFVYLGFRPKFLVIRNRSAAGEWMTYDSTRQTSNLMNLILNLAVGTAEVTASQGILDFLSNGFKIRGSSANVNTSGNVYIYMAFAENPFKFSLAR
jgi:hypothetical protein